jgi:hypothetical protein
MLSAQKTQERVLNLIKNNSKSVAGPMEILFPQAHRNTRLLSFLDSLPSGLKNSTPPPPDNSTQANQQEVEPPDFSTRDAINLVNRLGEHLKKTGRTTFTLADFRIIERGEQSRSWPSEMIQGAHDQQKAWEDRLEKAGSDN